MTTEMINRSTDVENNTLDYVDLGLPSGTKWMKCNIGASKETDYGLYFQWGATVGYSGDDAKAYSYWSTCPGNCWGAEYNSIEFEIWDNANLTNLTDGVLNTSVDAAYVHTNGKAKMPTEEQFQELIDNTISEWVTIDGVNGRKFTSKSNSSKYIFFPASGDFDDGSQDGIGSYGGYWSSSVYQFSNSSAQYLYFDCSKVYASDTEFRYNAQSVRGVLV